MYAIVLSIVFLGATVIDFWISHLAKQIKNQAAHMLSCCLFFVALVNIFYFISITSNHLVLAPFANTICFCLMDAALLYLVCFFVSYVYTRIDRNKRANRLIMVLNVIALLDMINILSNLFFGHVATYTYIGPEAIPHFSFEPHLSYFLHLGFCYFVIVYGLFVLLRETIHIPEIYRSPLLRMVGSLVFVFLLNIGYMYFYSDDTADLTILVYSIMGVALYVSAFVQGKQYALKTTCQTVIGSSTQPTVIFDHRGLLFYVNEAAKELFSNIENPSDPLHFEQFLKLLNLEDMPRVKNDRARFYWTPSTTDAYSYICDYQELVDKNDQDRRIARSIIFTNNTLNVDPLTGYLTEQYFDTHADEFLGNYDMSHINVAVCDLNQLGLINNVMGYSRGDDALEFQADTIRKHLPGRTIFVRLRDAKLCAICYGMPRDEIKTRLGFANDELSADTSFTMTLRMDYAVCELEANESVVEAVSRATSVLKTRKLLDSNSGHSNVIDSLTQMLSEVDTETEAHVRRTRILGDGLAFELGLSDYERDQLSLLCLFHDIGKVGIPLNILNKPGALTNEERAIMREHVKKGYRIARATSGLEIVAEPILHHHENWDGSGYPDGLQHEAIPILSRIISVVDSYDAMVSDRPYHRGIPIAEACKELQRCAGTQFDPYIVDAFVRMIGEKSSPEEVLEGSVKEDELRGTSVPDTKDILPSKVALVGPVRYSQYLLDDEMRIVQIDPLFTEFTGYTQYDVEDGKLSQNDLLFEEDREDYWKFIAQDEAKGIGYLEHRIRRKDGTGCYVYCLGIVVPTPDGPRTKIIVTDVTDSLSMQRQMGLARNRAMMSLRRLEETIQHDSMTGLLNKAAFKKNCKRAFLDSSLRFILIMIDLDDFKNYNDTYGHPKGDELLVHFARALSGSVRENDLTCRMGGDEFGCLLEFKNTMTLDEIIASVNKFWERLREKFVGEDYPSFSGGAAYVIQGAANFDDLYERADKNLYRAKDAGKNRIHIA